MADLSPKEVAERMVAAGKTEAVVQISGREMWVVVNPEVEGAWAVNSLFILFQFFTCKK